MARPPKAGIPDNATGSAKPAIPAYPLWIAILIVTALSIILLAVPFFAHPGPLEPGREFITLLLMLSFSTAVAFALMRRNMKLLYCTGVLELIVLALPAMVFNRNPPFVPYSLSMAVILIAFPALWLMLPVAVMRSEKDKERRKGIFYALLLISLCVLISLVRSCGSESSFTCGLITFPIVAFPLIVWYVSYRQMNAPPQAKKPGILERWGVDPSVFALVAAFICIMVVGFLMVNSQTGRSGEVCGDGVCSGLNGEDSYTCMMDCSPYPICGDGLCANDERSSCVSDCGATVKVLVSGGTGCGTIQVDLKDQSGDVISSKVSSSRAVTFTSYALPAMLSADTVYAEISSPDAEGKYVRSPPVRLMKTSLNIDMTLRDDFCTMPPEMGTLEISFKDSETDQLISGVDMAIFDPSAALIETSFLGGNTHTTRLKGDEWYYVNAEKDGYEDYLGDDNKFYIAAGDARTITIELTPIV